MGVVSMVAMILPFNVMLKFENDERREEGGKEESYQSNISALNLSFVIWFILMLLEIKSIPIATSVTVTLHPTSFIIVNHY